MVRWEYCYLLWYSELVGKAMQADFIEKTAMRFREVEGKTIAFVGQIHYLGANKIELVDSFSSAIADLGRDGWELVSLSKSAAHVDYFYFKRPISE